MSVEDQFRAYEESVKREGLRFPVVAAGDPGYPRSSITDCDFDQPSGGTSSSSSSTSSEVGVVTPRLEPAASPPGIGEREAHFYEGILRLGHIGPPIPFAEWKTSPHPKTSFPPGASELFNLDFTSSEEETPGEAGKAHRDAKREHRRNKRVNFRGLRTAAWEQGREFVRRHSSSHLACGFKRGDCELLGREFGAGVVTEVTHQRNEARKILQLPPETPEPPSRRRDTAERESRLAGRRCSNNCCDPAESGPPRARSRSL